MGTIYNQSGAWYAEMVIEILRKSETLLNKLVGGGRGEISSGICNVKKLSRPIKKGITSVVIPHVGLQ